MSEYGSPLKKDHVHTTSRPSFSILVQYDLGVMLYEQKISLDGKNSAENYKAKYW
jgi:hypothetical protein